jgi:hypothetical protein
MLLQPFKGKAEHEHLLFPQFNFGHFEVGGMMIIPPTADASSSSRAKGKTRSDWGCGLLAMK